MEKRFRIYIAGGVAIVLIALAVFMIQCQSGPTPKKLPLVRLNIVTWPGYGPIYLANDKGFFKEEGVDVDCQIQENTQARHAALVSGEVDLIGITLESVVLVNGQGIPMQVIGISDISDGGDGIIAKNNVASIKDLKDKRVAFPEGQPSHLLLLYELDKAGLTPKDVKPVYTDDAGKAGEIFAAGQVDAAVTWEPWLSQATEGGKGHVLVNSKGVKDILIGIFGADRDRVPKDLDKLQRFLRGWYRGLEYAQAHKEESIPIMAKGFGMPAEDFGAILGGLRWIGKDEAKRMLGADGTKGDFFQISNYEEELWQKAGAMKNSVDPGLVYTNRVISGVK
jgi:NitT/TauT family transport system substrate-binding protein